MINVNTLYEKLAAYRRYGLILAVILASSFSMIQAQSCAEKTLVRYNMNNCESFSSNGSNFDFSEFNANYPNAADCIDVSATNLSNGMGAHSCVEGANGSYAGICVEGEPGYNFVNNDDDAIQFSITVEPGQAGWLTELSFYQFSPTYYAHISGNTGSNKYLRKFGVRILKDGTQVYKSTGHNTNQNDWELATFDLSNDPDFEITTTTTFTFEILGYRPISSGTPRFFDVDEIKVKGCCQVDPCASQGGDNDNDGVCADQDCDDNDANLPAAPGTACNDGNPSTVNDVIQADGCNCAGTFDACATAGGDNDNDGVCADEDCDDNNPNIPAAEGTACNDGDANTENDVILADGCSCEGTPISTGPDCNDINISTEPGKIVVTGLDGAPVTSLQIFTATWQQVFSCFGDCGAMEMVNVPSGDYIVYAKYYTASYASICQENQTVTVTGGGCPDADNDGTCDEDDCQPNNAAFPAAPGSSCDDGNPNTTDDTVTADGCGCEGTPISGCDNISNGGQIGSDQTICAGESAATLTNVQSPSGGSGGLEYIWLSSTSSCPTSLNQTIAGATSATYNPGVLSTTTYFVRCSRRTGCSDWTVGESNCVTVTVDNSPSCGGGGGDPDCADISITAGNGSITVDGLDGAPISSLQIFNSNWGQEFSCFADCNATETISLPNGTYMVYAKYYTSSYALICQKVEDVTVGGGGCDDADNDGTCDDDDCQPNNPNFPAAPGSACNDGNPNTENDVVTADGCGCEGTPVGTCDNVTNGGQIGFGNGCDNASTICGASGDVDNIGSCQNASGGSGNIEYLWLRNPVNCNPPTVTVAQIQANPNSSNWQIISGATSANYNPGTISTSTCYIRCARRAGCVDYLGESNIVSVTVDPNCGGGDPDCNDISITTGTGSITVSGLDGAPISSLQIFNASWQQEFSCFADCSATETVSVPSGTYQVYAKYYTSSYALICQEVQSVTVGGGGCDDADNDGTCDADDCQPNNPAFPDTPGASCNDGNPNTVNDVITADGCGCEGTPVSGCDNVNNGGQIGSDQTICAGESAATLTNVQSPSGGSGGLEYIWLSSTTSCPTNLNQTIAGATSATYNPGALSTTTYFVRCSRRTGCSDWTVGESNCVTVTVDESPNCGGGGPDCNDISITTEPGKIIVSGLDGAPITSLQVFNASWQQEFSCFADCSAMEMVDLPAGTYYVYVKYYTASYSLICQENPTVTVTGGGCPDADNDGTCDDDDCQPNNPAFPAAPGTACNDGNPNTVNDVIQSDGCSCAGTFDACATAGGDNDNDGVCADEDCDDNNPNLPAAPGTTCDDGNPNTVNDVIQSDGCSCAGTFDACATAGGDNDNDGVCADEDCDDNNPNLPAAPGTACNDGNPNTINDVIQADGCSCEGTAPVVSMETCGNNCFIYEGNVDYTAIGNSMNYSEARDNCNKKSNSSSTLNIPSGSTIVSATLHWSGSGSLDNTVKLNGQTIYADQTFTDYSTSWDFFGAYADVTAEVQSNGTYTVSGLAWDNSYSVCQANAAYGAWSIVVVYANANNDNCRVHVCQDIFDFTYPEGTYNGSLHCVEATPGCSPNAELTFITFESDGYKGEHLYIGGQYFGDNNFNGQTAPNLDIATFDLNSAFDANSSSLHYSIQSYYTNTIWGPAIEGLFDFVKVLKYDVCSSQNLIATTSNEIAFQVNQWEEHSEILFAHNEGHLVDHYILERSADERIFMEIETINSNGYEGMESYTSFDAAPLVGDNYYRVKMVNLDGTIAYTAIEKVHFADLVDFDLFPNPANNFVKVNLEAVTGNEVDIHFYNNLGQRVKEVHIDEVYNKYYQIDINDLKEGHYNVWMQIPGKRAVTKTLMIGRL